ncbi:MAG TPA: hypothetical protein VK711_06755, partial [Puia sp.]|nr:hypothetical protein [Puia sp.]
MHRISLMKNFLIPILGLWIMHSMSSCGTTKGLLYIHGPFDTAKLSQINPVEPIIRKGDILSIIVYSDNPEATKIYNQSLITTAGAGGVYGTAAGVSGSAPAAPGYQVDLDGNMVFQGLG